MKGRKSQSEFSIDAIDRGVDNYTTAAQSCEFLYLKNSCSQAPESWNCGQFGGSTKAQFIKFKTRRLLPESLEIKGNLEHQRVTVGLKCHRLGCCEIQEVAVP
ncbi:hypothetical protein O3M35_011536 [Rhynocoris fuscipes]|uniref:Uncharacterized protein n=1 Tax=Rhynocoris fuscipes TaxID=488301 RepID=A0AAW1CZ68_9HEMI